MEKKIYQAPSAEVLEFAIENVLLAGTQDTPSVLPVDSGENGQGYDSGEIIDL